MLQPAIPDLKGRLISRELLIFNQITNKSNSFLKKKRAEDLHFSKKNITLTHYWQKRIDTALEREVPKITKNRVFTLFSNSIYRYIQLKELKIEFL